MTAFCGSPLPRSVKNTALWSDPPRYCRKGKVPSTTWPSHFFNASVMWHLRLTAQFFSGLGASIGTTPWKGIWLDVPYYQDCLLFQLTLRPVVFFDSNQILWQGSQDSIPANGETRRVLRPL